MGLCLCVWEMAVGGEGWCMCERRRYEVRRGIAECACGGKGKDAGGKGGDIGRGSWVGVERVGMRGLWVRKGGGIGVVGICVGDKGGKRGGWDGRGYAGKREGSMGVGRDGLGMDGFVRVVGG